MKRSLLGLLIAVALPAMAQQLADGEIRKVDKKAETITIKHGPIQAIDMPAMTMVFQVKEAEMRVGGKVAVTQIELVK